MSNIPSRPHRAPPRYFPAGRTGVVIDIRLLLDATGTSARPPHVVSKAELDHAGWKRRCDSSWSPSLPDIYIFSRTCGNRPPATRANRLQDPTPPGQRWASPGNQLHQDSARSLRSPDGVGCRVCLRSGFIIPSCWCCLGAALAPHWNVARAWLYSTALLQNELPRGCWHSTGVLLAGHGTCSGAAQVLRWYGIDVVLMLCSRGASLGCNGTVLVL